MHRLTVLVAVVMAILWQSVALARFGATINVHADAPHAVLHLLNAEHHHETDGSIHRVDSKESQRHLTVDQVNIPALLADLSAPLLRPENVSPDPLGFIGHPQPCLAGLLRPPRRAA